jgi:hypothetical protein
MNLDRGVRDLIVDGQPLAYLLGRQSLIVGDDAESAGVGRLANPPDVRIGHRRLACRAAFVADLANFLDHRVIHSPVEQRPG